MKSILLRFYHFPGKYIFVREGICTVVMRSLQNGHKFTKTEITHPRKTIIRRKLLEIQHPFLPVLSQWLVKFQLQQGGSKVFDFIKLTQKLVWI